MIIHHFLCYIHMIIYVFYVLEVELEIFLYLVYRVG